MAFRLAQLVTTDHSRDSAGLTYVYPVLSRRAGGVSVGINLNPNNACNWRCIYCQVPNLGRGGPPPIDLGLLRRELHGLLESLSGGGHAAGDGSADAPRLLDVAFSGNGEPTSAAEFADAVDIAAQVLRELGLSSSVKLRLITNGSLVARTSVRRGIARIGAEGGEVWFKVDRATNKGMVGINGTRGRPEIVEHRLCLCGSLSPTWAQTCLFAVDGQPPAEAELAALLELLARVRQRIAGVHLYGLARPSAQPEAARLQRLPAAWLDGFAGRIREKGLTVIVSP